MRWANQLLLHCRLSKYNCVPKFYRNHSKFVDTTDYRDIKNVDIFVGTQCMWWKAEFCCQVCTVVLEICLLCSDQLGSGRKSHWLPAAQWWHRVSSDRSFSIYLLVMTNVVQHWWRLVCHVGCSNVVCLEVAVTFDSSVYVVSFLYYYLPDVFVVYYLLTAYISNIF